MYTELIVHGPLSLLLGLVLGAFGGMIIACTNIWNMRWKRSFLTFALGMAFTLGMTKLHYLGSGAVSAMIMGMVGSICWSNGVPHILAVDKAKGKTFAHETETDIGYTWDVVFKPLLFGVIGMSVDFTVLKSSTVPKSILLVIIGLLV